MGDSGPVSSLSVSSLTTYVFVHLRLLDSVCSALSSTSEIRCLSFGGSIDSFVYCVW